MPIHKHHPKQPQEGHSFRDGGILLRDDTVDGLLAKIALYRKNNGLPAGAPEQELERYYQTRYPWLVTDVVRGGKPVVYAQEHPSEPLRTWMARLWRDPPKQYARDVDQEKRLATCKACPHYGEMPELEPEDQRRLLILSQGKMPGGYCAIQRWACELACTLDKPDARPVDGCWVGDTS